MANVMFMPKLSDTMDEGVILKWRKREGDQIKQGEILADIQSDKADMEQEAYESGVILKLFAKEGEGVKVGKPLAIIGKEGEDIATLLTADQEKKVPEKNAHISQVSRELAGPAPTTPSDLSEIPASIANVHIKASPLAKKIAQEMNLNLSAIVGSGPGGRIVKKDVQGMPGGSPSIFPQKIAAGKTEEIPLTMMRKTIAKRLLESKTTIPHFYLTNEVDMKEAIQFRTALNRSGENKISFNDVILKAVAFSLRQHPKVNASFAGDRIIQHGSIHIGVAVAVDEGLVTPCIRNADIKGLAEISRESKDLAQRARERKLKPEEFQGGTFTVSNLGMYDIENFSAIINPPEGAILAVGSIVEKPVVDDGHLAIGKRMKLTLSCDHRVIDGATGAQFMQSLKKILENPATLAL